MRRPVDQPFETREHLWGVIRQLGVFSLPALAAHSRLEISTIESYVQGLVRAGYLEKTEVAPEGAKERSGGFAVRFEYRLERDSLEPPRINEKGEAVVMGKGRTQIWRAMHILKHFDLAAIWAASGTEDHPVALEELKTYIRYLVWAGYLKKKGEGRKATYLLVRYTGPRPPMIQRTRQVYDANEKKVVWSRTEEDKT